MAPFPTPNKQYAHNYQLAKQPNGTFKRYEFGTDYGPVTVYDSNPSGGDSSSRLEDVANDGFSAYIPPNSANNVTGGTNSSLYLGRVTSGSDQAFIA